MPVVVCLNCRTFYRTEAPIHCCYRIWLAIMSSKKILLNRTTSAERLSEIWNRKCVIINLEMFSSITDTDVVLMPNLELRERKHSPVLIAYK